MTFLPRLPMTKKVRAVLAENVGDMQVGLATIPRIPEAEGSSTLVNAEPPYFIIYPLWANTSGPPFAAPDADAEWVYQIGMFGLRGDQLEWMRDKVLGTFLARNPDGSFVTPLVVDGMSVMDRSLKEDPGGEPDHSAAILSTFVRVGIQVTPA